MSDLNKITSAEIKQQLSISDVLKHYGGQCTNNSSGAWWCLIHEQGGRGAGHKTPSLVAKDQTGTATCMSQGCFSGDDIFGVIAKMENLSDFNQIKQKACDIAGIIYSRNVYSSNLHFKGSRSVKDSPNEEIHGSTNKRQSTATLEPLQDVHINYLASIGISKATAELLKLKSRYDYILYPQMENEEIIGYKGISITKDSVSGKSKMFFEGSKNAIWPNYNLKPNTHLIFTEGEKDCMRLTEEIKKEGKENEYSVITITTGAKTIPKNILAIVKNLKPSHISIFYDNDKAGFDGSMKLAEELAKELNEVDVYYFHSDNKEGYDITDFLNEQGNAIQDLFNLDKDTFTQHKTLDETEFFSNTSLAFQMGDLSSDPPQIKWLIEEFLAEGRVGAVIATGSTGKSWFLLQLAISIASGNDFMKLKNPNQGGKVLYVIGEEGKDDIHRRIFLIKKLIQEEQEEFKNEELANQNLSFLCVNGKHAVLDDQSTLYHDLKVFIKTQKPKLIILDPLVRFFNGDENNSTEMTRFMEVLESLNNMGTTILFAHHTSKVLSGELNQHSARGSTAVIDAIRWNLTLHKISRKDADKYKFEHTEEPLDPDLSDFYINAEIVKCNSFRPKKLRFTFKRSKFGALVTSNHLILK